MTQMLLETPEPGICFAWLPAFPPLRVAPRKGSLIKQYFQILYLEQ